MEPMSGVVVRRSVRIILIAPDQRVLLLGARDPDDGRAVWFMPGGGIEPGETVEVAAQRELHEELGPSRADVDLEGPVWKRRHQFTWDGREIDQHEVFLVGHLHDPLVEIEIRPSGPEGAYFIGARWLAVDEIRGWPDTIAPRRLGELLPSILAGQYPDTPIDVGI